MVKDLDETKQWIESSSTDESTYSTDLQEVHTLTSESGATACLTRKNGELIIVAAGSLVNSSIKAPMHRLAVLKKDPATVDRKPEKCPSRETRDRCSIPASTFMTVSRYSRRLC
jgi:hypothetical protein